MASQFPPRRILVIDDNRDLADLTAELLELHGYIVCVAYGGQQGIDAAIVFVPDVVLSDLGMPVVDGYAVATALRHLPPLRHSLLVAYSAWNDATTRARVIEYGFHAHLAKPAKLDDILRSVEMT